ncbi:MAG: polysaccharide biosynthesis/export family protein [Candidatus Palauibacterales bacterium]|nr:polysaccharide biosynthesis/export family protein [Candidatus Palauibacterales bacterium]
MIRSAVRMGLLTLAIGMFAAPALAQDDVGFDSPLRPGDVLRVSVWPDTDLSGEFPVEIDGNVYLPFLGGVRAIGIPGDELRRQIREGYQSAQRNAVVTVTPLYRIGVTGSVRRPGAYMVPPTDGFFDVIATAGGFDLRAREDRVSVIREGQVIVLNAKDAINKGETLPLDALTLRSGDQIIVPFGAEPWSRRDWIALGNFLISLILLYDRIQN